MLQCQESVPASALQTATKRPSTNMGHGWECHERVGSGVAQGDSLIHARCEPAAVSQPGTQCVTLETADSSRKDFTAPEVKWYVS